MGVETPIHTHSRPQSRPQGVPALNLNCFTKDEKPVIPIEISDYPLDSARSGTSTVSWGTSVSSARSYRPSSRREDTTPKYRQPSGKSSRPEFVPGLHLGYEEQSKPRVAPPKQDDVYREVAAIKNKTYGEIRAEVEAEYRNEESSEEEDVETDYLDQNWTKRHTYSTNQMLKKMDAEELLEYNKKQKLIETVLVDQLSRAVISDPEQDEKSRRPGDSARRGRGSHRYLHDSKVRTHSSATENLLSRRVRFGARILTRNGHDAMRELTGFYFEADKTLTIYEFRQFGKSAKALPFISREGQHTLPDTLKKQKEIYFRITNVDEEEKQKLMLEDVKPSHREKVYTQLHMQNKKEIQTRMIMKEIQDSVRSKLRKRGIKTVTGLGRYYRKEDTSGTGVLYRYALEKGLYQYHIDLSTEKLDFIFETLDPEEEGQLDYGLYMFGVIGRMNEFRKMFVLKAFKKIDTGKRGKITLNEIKKFFNASFRPVTNTGETPGVGALQAFIEAVQASPSQEEVSFVEFEEYYEGLSISIYDDTDFATVLHNTWNI
ncbi:hypothetical protein KUTeg_006819 [Tegillarca granosa]|uniref:EF-hand domain-containing protein n=1 Tax=Tegillarca granosa TaxID=220873 RepID=A0ABQ9FBE8_TEGGR|nr:hypothetical protein KUTeg_006819 [Tegillarca granosa]